MKKENYGIPTMLLCVAIYVIGLFSAIGSVWPIVGVTILVFALQFDSNTKKTAVQSLGLALIVSAIYIVFNVIDVFVGMIDTYATLRSNNGFLKFMDTLEDLVKLATYIVYGVLIICAGVKNDIFVGKAHLVVDGFIPVKPMPQQMYNGQPQQFNGVQPMNNGAPMNAGQPTNGVQSMRGGQATNGVQPMHGAQSTNGVQPMHGGQPMNGVQPMRGGQPMNGAQSMHSAHPMNGSQMNSSAQFKQFSDEKFKPNNSQSSTNQGNQIKGQDNIQK